MTRGALELNAHGDGGGVISGPGHAALTSSDLAGLLATFNEVTNKLQSAHDSLRGEVARLTSELHEANEQVERSKRLAALGEMAAGIAHEVRNPLGSIRLYATMLEEDLANDANMAAIAGKINGAARVVEGIVGDVLSFARELKLRMEPIGASELFEHVLGMCEHERAKVKTLEVVRSCVKGTELTCDGTLLTQAMVNIVQNAMQAMAAAGNVYGQSHRLELSCTRTRAALGGRARLAAVRLRVRDSGPGVSAEIVSRMFNPFFTTRSMGTGLGLAIVHRIVDAHGGRIEVRNNAEMMGEMTESERAALGEFAMRGACVDVLLPVKQAASASKSQRHMNEASAAVEIPDVHGSGAKTAQELALLGVFDRM
jgi:signal transduction histidine kinase